MGKLLRLVAWLAGILVVLVLIASVVLPMVVDPNDYKDDIATLVESKTGRTLTIDGDIGLSVFPWLAFEIGPTRLSNAEGFSERPFASVEDVQVRLKLLPLLRKQVEMDTLVLNGLQLSMETRADGTTNWQDLAAADEPAAEPETPDAATEPAEPGGLALAGLAIGGVQVTDAVIIWDDRAGDVRYSVDDLDLTTGAISPGEPIPVTLGLALDSSNPPFQGLLTFGSEVTLTNDNQTIQLADGQITVDLKGEGMPGGALDASVGFNAVVDLAAQTLDLSELVAKTLGLVVEAQLQGRQILGDMAFDGTLKVNEFVPRDVIKALGVLAPEVSDPAVLGKADASMTLAGTADSVQVSDMVFRLDDSTLSGQAGVSHFSKPAIRYTLKLDGIDVDRYLPPDAEPVPATPTTAAAAGADMIPVETLKALDVDGTFTIGQLKVSGLKSSDIVMKLVAKSGLLRVHPASANLYQGSYTGDIKLDVRGKQPKISLNDKLAGVEVGPLLKDLTGDDTLSGTTNANATLVTSGQSPEQMKQTLNGKLGFSFSEGAVKGFNLAAILRKAEAALKGEPAPDDSGPNQTDFSELSGTASITNGVVRNRDLLAKSPLLRVQGEGDVDLPNEALDYLVKVKVVGSLEGQGGKGSGELKGLTVPVKLSGTFAEPKYKVQLDQVLKDSAEKKVKKKLEKKLEKKFGDQFKGLFQ